MSRGASGLKEEGPAAPLPFAFDSVEQADALEHWVANLRERLATLEASSFFLRLERLFTREGILEMSWHPDSAEIFALVRSDPNEEPASLIRRQMDIGFQLRDLKLPKPRRRELVAEGASLARIHSELGALAARFKTRASEFFNPRRAIADDPIQKHNTWATLSPGSAVQLARQCGFDELASLMEAGSLDLASEKAGSASRPASSL